MSNFIKVQDLNRGELDVYVRLTGAELRHTVELPRGVFIAESPTVIEVALAAGCEPISVLTDERLLSGVLKKTLDILPRDLPVYVSDRDTLKAITGFELTRGALCAFRRPSEKTLSELTENARRIAVFEGITDATNIGALFRSAAAFNIDAVLITPTCHDPLSRRALRVSMGTVLQIPWGRIGKDKEDWERNGREILRSLGFKSVSMALTDESVPIDHPSLRAEERLAIVLGTEGDGLSKNTILTSDYTARIPMAHGVDSLNVAAAGAVAFYVLSK